MQITVLLTCKTCMNPIRSHFRTKHGFDCDEHDQISETNLCVGKPEQIGEPGSVLNHLLANSSRTTCQSKPSNVPKEVSK